LVDSEWQVVAEYVWGPLGPLMQRRYNAQTQSWYNYYYVQDGLGHTRLLLDGNGNVINRYAYDAWGNLIDYEEAVPNPFTWNGAYGYEWIPLTGLYHVGAREYDPRTARWLQRDPIDISGGDPNFYQYCGRDPINLYDVNGSQEAKKQGTNDAILGKSYDRDCTDVMQDLARALRSLKKDIDNWQTLHAQGLQKTDRGHAAEIVNRCIHLMRSRRAALSQCSDYEIAGSKEWRDLVRNTFDYIRQHCNPNPGDNSALRGVSDKKHKELKDEWRKNAPQIWDPGIVDITPVLMPAAAGLKCGSGAIGLWKTFMDWLKSRFPGSKPGVRQPSVPKKAA
jgi:RHS repeat-associated protein